MTQNLLIMNLASAFRNLTMTEKKEIAFKSSTDKSLDFFVQIVRNSPVEKIVQQFQDAYNEDPEKALKVLFNFRDVRGGKGERLISYVCLLWLKYHAPHVYQKILKTIIHDFGCWKDILFLYKATIEYNNLTKESSMIDIDSFENVEVPFDNVFEVQLLADQLNEDYQRFSKGEGFSLAVKWAPSEGKKYKQFAKELQTNLNINPRNYRQKISAMRKRLRLFEDNMSNNKESEIIFEALPSRCHRINRKALKRDCNAKKKYSLEREILKDRYNAYLDNKEAKINFKGTQPHELVHEYLKNIHVGWSISQTDETIEKQWTALVEDIKHSGSFEKSMAVVDVSGSMDGQPVEVAVALGLLTSACAMKPYHGIMITFETQPKFIDVKDLNTLKEKIQKTINAPWGGNTNIQAVFELILNVACTHKLGPEGMVEKIFIFTDMQFDRVDGHHWDSTFAKIKTMFKGCGYEVPQLIVWNLRDSFCLPSLDNHEGVCYLSGFSGELLKAVLETPGKFDASFLLNKIINKYPTYRVVLPYPIKNKLDLEALQKALKVA